MGAGSLQLISVFQESLTETPAQQANANTTPLNPNQAQGAAVPQDTVTLTGQAAQDQQTGQDPQQQAQFQETVITFAGMQISIPANNTNPGAQQPAAPAQLPVAVSGAPTTAATAANTIKQNPPAAAATNAATNAPTNAATNNNGPQTPQQQLQQLDQALQQLGINPESISLFNRMALLLYANDPAALETFVQQLQQQVTQQSGQTAATSATVNDSDAAAAAPQQQAQPLTTAQQQTQPSSDANPAIPAFPPLNQGTGTNQVSGSGPNQLAGDGSAATGNDVFVQFEELQVAFATVGQDQTPAQEGSPPVPQGQLLSVTV